MEKIRSIANLPTKHGEVQLISFSGLHDNKEHVAVGLGYWQNLETVDVRIHSECFTGDVLGSSKCECGDQLNGAILEMVKTGGIILYLRQEGRGIGLYSKIDAYNLQEQGYDTVEANHHLGFNDDLRDYEVAAQMLAALNKTKVKLHTNNLKKVEGLQQYGIDVVQRIPTQLYIKPENKNYLLTKALKSGHLFSSGNLDSLISGLTNLATRKNCATHL